MTGTATAASTEESAHEIRHRVDANPILVLLPDEDTQRRADYLAQRIHVVLFDLGLNRIVPTAWITPVDDGLAFTVLTIRQADQLVRRLEDLALANKVIAPSPGTTVTGSGVIGNERLLGVPRLLRSLRPVR